MISYSSIVKYLCSRLSLITTKSDARNQHRRGAYCWLRLRPFGSLLFWRFVSKCHRCSTRRTMQSRTERRGACSTKCARGRDRGRGGLKWRGRRKWCDSFPRKTSSNFQDWSRKSRLEHPHASSNSITWSWYRRVLGAAVDDCASQPWWGSSDYDLRIRKGVLTSSRRVFRSIVVLKGFVSELQTFGRHHLDCTMFLRMSFIVADSHDRYSRESSCRNAFALESKRCHNYNVGASKART